MRLAIWVTLLLLAGPAMAQRRGLVALTATRAPAATVTLPGEVVREPVGEARAARAAGAVPRARLARFARARQLVHEGWRAFLSADLAFAEARLVEARHTLEDVLGLDGALEELADVMLRLAAVRQKAGRMAEAEAAFALARALDPERELHAGEWSPGVIAAFSRPGGSARATLVVHGGGAVEIDGRAASASTSVEPGEHVVRVRAPGRQVAAQIVSVPAAGAELTIEGEPEEAIGELALGMRSDDAVRVAVQVFEHAELDELVLVVATWRGGQPALLGQRCGAPRSCTDVLEVRVEAPGQLPAGARRLVEDLQRAPLRGLPPSILSDRRALEPEPPRAGGAARRPPERAWWKSPWLWAAAGGLLVAAGTTAVLLVDEPAPTIHVELPAPP